MPEQAMTDDNKSPRCQCQSPKSEVSSNHCQDAATVIIVRKGASRFVLVCSRCTFPSDRQIARLEYDD